MPITKYIYPHDTAVSSFRLLPDSVTRWNDFNGNNTDISWNFNNESGVEHIDEGVPGNDSDYIRLTQIGYVPSDYPGGQITMLRSDIDATMEIDSIIYRMRYRTSNGYNFSSKPIAEEFALNYEFYDITAISGTPGLGFDTSFQDVISHYVAMSGTNNTWQTYEVAVDLVNNTTSSGIMTTKNGLRPWPIVYQGVNSAVDINIAWNYVNAYTGMPDIDISAIEVIFSGVYLNTNETATLYLHNPYPSGWDTIDLSLISFDTINSDPTGLPLYVYGDEPYTDSLDLLVLGGGKSAGLNLFLQGENYKSLTDTVNLYIQNDFESDPSGTFPLTINSSYKDNSYLNMVVKGPTVDDVTTYMNLYTGGYSWQSKSGIQNLSISGEYFSTLPSGVWNDSISMIMPGSFKYNTYMNLYTRGLGPQNETDVENSPTLNLSLASFLEKSGELNLNLLGGGYSAGMNLYLKALDGTPTNSGVDLTVWGTNNSGLFGTFDIYMNSSNEPSGVMNLYTAGTPQTFDNNTNMNIFLKGIGNLDGSITKTADIDFTLYNNWKTAEQSGLDMIVVTRSGTEGAVPVSGNMNLYLSRTEGMSHQFPLAMLGPDSTTDTVDLYLNGTPNHRDNVSLYISGIEVKNDLMRLYVNGT